MTPDVARPPGPSSATAPYGPTGPMPRLRGVRLSPNLTIR
jgi:hypothetical protein